MSHLDMYKPSPFSLGSSKYFNAMQILQAISKWLESINNNYGFNEICTRYFLAIYSKINCAEG